MAQSRFRRWSIGMLAGALLAPLTPAAPAAAAAAPTAGPVAGRWLDGNPATTERVAERNPVVASVAVARRRFDAASSAGRRAAHAVLARQDDFADALAGSVLTGAGPLLLTDKSALPAATRSALRDLLAPGATVYLLGGTAAIGDEVAARLSEDGFAVRRLAGRTRVETSVAVAEAALPLGASRTVLLARSTGVEGSPGSAWVDSIAAGGWSAASGTAILFTPTDALHPAVAAWLRRTRPERAWILGGRAALSDAVARAVEAEGATATRVSGPERSATAAAIATRLWGATTEGARRFTVVNGARDDGWTFGLAAAGIAADERAPVLLATPGLTAAVRPLVSACGAPQVDTVLVGDGSVLSTWLREELEASDGGACAGRPTRGARLTAFDSCAATHAWFVQAGLEQVGPYGLENVFYTVAVAEAGFGQGGAAGGDGAAPGSGGPVSGTNIQEAGVDEPDILKTDGRISVAVTGNRLHVLALTDGDPVLQGGLDLPVGYGHELFLAGNRVLVLSRGFGGEASSSFAPSPVPSVAETRLTAVDISDPGAPRTTASTTVDGSYQSARLVDGVVRVVVTSQPGGMEFTAPEDHTEEAHQAALEHNRSVIASSTADQWLPRYRSGESAEGASLVDCSDVGRPPWFSGLATTTVFTVDIAGDLTPRSSAAVVGDGGIVYGSTGGVYVATTRWGSWLPEADDPNGTEIHAFDAADPDGVRYRASARVDGWLLNQWSLSEHAGHLRVATTLQPPWLDVGGTSSSSVVVLDAPTLREVGRIDGLGLGERIYAVRFMGDLGAVVTFRQIDPLYLLDLSQPTAPTVLGELKIPGYSAYLHRVGETQLLGIGQDADEDGRTLGVQVSLFDIADPRNPQRVAQLGLGQGWTEVEHDHRAFLHWPAADLAVVPVALWNESGPGRSGASAVGIGDGTLVQRAFVQHPGAQETHLPVRRSFVAGERLYTMSELGLAASDLASLEARGWVAFPQQDQGAEPVEPAGGIG